MEYYVPLINIIQVLIFKVKLFNKRKTIAECKYILSNIQYGYLKNPDMANSVIYFIK